MCLVIISLTFKVDDCYEIYICMFRKFSQFFIIKKFWVSPHLEHDVVLVHFENHDMNTPASAAANNPTPRS